MAPAPSVPLAMLVPLTALMAFTVLTALMPLNPPVMVPASMVIAVETLVSLVLVVCPVATSNAVVQVPSAIPGAVIVNRTAGSRPPSAVPAVVRFQLIPHNSLISPPLKADTLSLVVQSLDPHTIVPVFAKRVRKGPRVVPVQAHPLDPCPDRSIAMRSHFNPLSTRSADAHPLESVTTKGLREADGVHSGEVHLLDPKPKGSVFLPLDSRLKPLTVHGTPELHVPLYAVVWDCVANSTQEHRIDELPFLPVRQSKVAEL